ncbi:synaptic vesicle glycoprotein 2C-like, partial [Asbolus verrucosus]
YVEKAQIADFETAIHYSTECDFNLSSIDKGKLSAMPLIGMIFGCSLWGSIADSQGRKIAIMLSLLVDFFAAMISSFANTFQLFLICRFFNGFGIIGATSIIFSYLGEFASKKHRDVMLGRLEVFWNVGVILLPGLAWVLLNRTILESFSDHGNFSPWRIFVLVCSLPSLISLVMLYFLPETPKFLISKGQYEKAKLVFQKVFTFNTGHPYYTYPVMTLEGEYENNNNTETSIKEEPLKFRLYRKIHTSLDEMKVLFSQPYLKYLGITCFADFGLMASYYTLIMWFPEIFERFNQYELAHPNSTASVCTVSESSKDTTEVFFPEPCNPAIDSRVFLDTIIIGLSCIPTSVSLSFFMKKLGKKFVLIAGLVLSGLSTLSLNWVQTATETLVLSCIFEALTSILEAVIFCIIVDLFPTNLRAIALAVTATSGRIGAIFGNVALGLLIDLKCFIPIYLFGSLLI